MEPAAFQMFQLLSDISRRPEPFEFYTAGDLWTDEHTSERMLELHLNETVDVASRNTAFIDRSVAWIASRFDLRAGTRVADFGCGPGLYATRLAQRGAAVTGIDFSERSIRYAQGIAAGQGLSIRYVHRNYLEFETADRFHLILLIMCDFCALSPAQRKQLLTQFHALLAPGGLILLDVYSLAAFDQWREQATYGADLFDGFWSADRYFGFLHTFKYDREKLVLDQHTIVEPSRVRTVYNWFQCFSPEGLAGELAACGLAVEGFHADVAGSPFDPAAKEFAVVGKKL